VLNVWLSVTVYDGTDTKEIILTPCHAKLNNLFYRVLFSFIFHRCPRVHLVVFFFAPLIPSAIPVSSVHLLFLGTNVVTSFCLRLVSVS
jgi:hypothetical protein